MSSGDLTIGVLGGMGPQATCDFLEKLIVVTPVQHEQDHFRVLVDSNAKVPDRTRALLGQGESPGPALADMACGLERMGADFLVVVCNSAHGFEADIRAAIDIPFVSMIDEVCNYVESLHPSATRVGVLAAQGCIDAKIYQTAFSNRGCETLVPTEENQRRFMSLLYRIKCGDLSDEVRNEMIKLAQALIDAGADVVVAGCTEVPLMIREGDLSKTLLDATLILAHRCVRYARRIDPLPGAIGVE